MTSIFTTNHSRRTLATFVDVTAAAGLAIGLIILAFVVLSLLWPQFERQVESYGAYLVVGGRHD